MFTVESRSTCSSPPVLLVYGGFNPAAAGLDSVVLLPSLPLPVLGGSAGGVTGDVREARPPDQRGSGGDDEQALQGCGVVRHVGAAAQACVRVHVVAHVVAHVVVYDGDAGTGAAVHAGAAPAVLPDDQRAAA